MALTVITQAARADTLQFEVDGFTVTSVLSGNNTILTLTKDSNTNAGLFTVNGSAVASTNTSPLSNVSSYTGTITINRVLNTVSGSFSVSDLLGNTYSVASLSGDYQFVAGTQPQVSIHANTAGGQFFNPTLPGNTPPGLNTPVFEGVDVSFFNNHELLSGNLFQFDLNARVFYSNTDRPTGVGTHITSDANVNARIQIAAVPLPAAAWGGLSLFGLIGGLKFRRLRSARDL